MPMFMFLVAKADATTTVLSFEASGKDAAEQSLLADGFKPLIGHDVSGFTHKQMQEKAKGLFGEYTRMMQQALDQATTLY